MPKATKKKSSSAKRDTKRRRTAKKRKYRVRNWAEYNEALKQRGSITVWVEQGMAEAWYDGEPTGKPGAKRTYSDNAITVTLQFGAVFHQRLRQTEGLVHSIFHAMGIDLDVPDYSTLSRRGETVVVDVPKTEKNIVFVIPDSTGLKVYGEGEWKVRKHGWSKHRTWQKFHLMISPDGEIRALKLTDNATTDAEVAPELLDQETAPTIMGFAGDGGYDRRNVYAACLDRRIPIILVPPQKNAKIFVHGNTHTTPHPRDENLRQIRKTSRTRWKEQTGYHVRSLVENTMFRLKTILGDRLNARLFPQQRTEAAIKARILNHMWQLGMPQSYAVA
jgi:hypothetical protein